MTCEDSRASPEKGSNERVSVLKPPPYLERKKKENDQPLEVFGIHNPRGKKFLKRSKKEKREKGGRQVSWDVLGQGGG